MEGWGFYSDVAVTFLKILEVGSILLMMQMVIRFTVGSSLKVLANQVRSARRSGKLFFKMHTDVDIMFSNEVKIVVKLYF